MLGFPEIIILDEPSVGLDPKQIIEIRELIRKLAKKHTVILSSHILAEVREVCDYIMIISKGKLVASDTPENLERYLGESKRTDPGEERTGYPGRTLYDICRKEDAAAEAESGSGQPGGCIYGADPE